MKILAATLIAVAYAQDDDKEVKETFTDSVVQKMPMEKDGKNYGDIAWYTRFYEMKDGVANVSEVNVHCMPRMEGGAGFTWADYNDKEIQCQFGAIATENQGNKADWCRMKIKVKTGDSTIEYMEIKDGKLGDYKNKGANDKWNFEDDGKQNCNWDKVASTLGKNDTMFMPTLAFMKPFKNDDGDDIDMAYKSNSSIAWAIKYNDAEVKGTGEGFYLDDPMMPVVTGAQALAAGVATAAALVYATL